MAPKNFLDEWLHVGHVRSKKLFGVPFTNFRSGVEFLQPMIQKDFKLSARPHGVHMTLLVKYNVLYFTHRDKIIFEGV